ncbi:hypothetical protein K7X08_028538 [Anisodus acutangulus]|uniref:Uncharacterized protein n=1 Tax=Anisodus acutangulus TaxID=402998 RepID=A0A9Q1M6P7_9SOLA|nr:hypothetical protein K7X08_028538 [Anisodus acutangulus]
MNDALPDRLFPLYEAEESSSDWNSKIYETQFVSFLSKVLVTIYKLARLVKEITKLPLSGFWEQYSIQLLSQLDCSFSQMNLATV